MKLFLLGKTASDTVIMLNEAFKDNVNHIFGWLNGFKRVEMSTEAQPSSHCPFMSKTDKNVKKASAVHEVHCLTIEEMAEMTRVIEFMSMYLKEDLFPQNSYMVTPFSHEAKTETHGCVCGDLQEEV